jgi:hypothetical protein
MKFLGEIIEALCSSCDTIMIYAEIPMKVSTSVLKISRMKNKEESWKRDAYLLNPWLSVAFVSVVCYSQSREAHIYHRKKQ